MFSLSLSLPLPQSPLLRCLIFLFLSLPSSLARLTDSSLSLSLSPKTGTLSSDTCQYFTPLLSPLETELEILLGFRSLPTASPFHKIKSKDEIEGAIPSDYSAAIRIIFLCLESSYRSAQLVMDLVTPILKKYLDRMSSGVSQRDQRIFIDILFHVITHCQISSLSSSSLPSPSLSHPLLSLSDGLFSFLSPLTATPPFSLSSSLLFRRSFCAMTSLISSRNPNGDLLLNPDRVRSTLASLTFCFIQSRDDRYAICDIFSDPICLSLLKCSEEISDENIFQFSVLNILGRSISESIQDLSSSSHPPSSSSSTSSLHSVFMSFPEFSSNVSGFIPIKGSNIGRKMLQTQSLKSEIGKYHRLFELLVVTAIAASSRESYFQWLFTFIAKSALENCVTTDIRSVCLLEIHLKALHAGCENRNDPFFAF